MAHFHWGDRTFANCDMPSCVDARKAGDVCYTDIWGCPKCGSVIQTRTMIDPRLAATFADPEAFVESARATMRHAASDCATHRDPGAPR